MAELRVLWVRGQSVVLAAPVPERAVLPLTMTTSLAVREWLVVTDLDTIHIAGHDFRVVGWSSSSTPGLVLEHDCQPCAHTCGPE